MFDETDFGAEAHRDHDMAGASRRQPSLTDALESKPLELVALWSKSRMRLRHAIDNETDWGPFELIEMIALRSEPPDAPRILCRFAYHGADEDYAHFENDLHRRLATITSWEDAPPPHEPQYNHYR